MTSEQQICCLCGKSVNLDAELEEDTISMDHVPPKQFFPLAIRIEKNPNLWKVPTHKRCNNQHKLDEEYFLHQLYPLVKNADKEMGDSMLQEIGRRAQKPQTRVLIRGLLDTCKTETDGGIVLPAPILQFTAHPIRIQNVAIKIAQGLFFRDHGRYMPAGNCKDIRLLQMVDEIPEWYQISWRFSETITSVLPEVFSYRSAVEEGFACYTLMFWDSFFFCLTFDDPAGQNPRCLE